LANSEVADLKRVNIILRENPVALAEIVTDPKKYIAELGRMYASLPPMPMRHKRKMCEA